MASNITGTRIEGREGIGERDDITTTLLCGLLHDTWRSGGCGEPSVAGKDVGLKELGRGTQMLDRVIAGRILGVAELQR